MTGAIMLMIVPVGLTIALPVVSAVLFGAIWLGVRSRRRPEGGFVRPALELPLRTLTLLKYWFAFAIVYLALGVPFGNGVHKPLWLEALPLLVALCFWANVVALLVQRRRARTNIQ